MHKRSTVLSEQELRGLRSAVRTIRNDVDHVYSRMSPKERMLGIKALQSRIFEAAIVRIENEGTLDDEATARQVRAELKTTLLGILEEEFDIKMGDP